MISQTASELEPDPTLAVAERQLVLLGELTEIVMAAARAFGASALAAAQAETMILSEEWFTPEVGRARACGAKDAAESLQKVARAARLTMKLQMAVAEIVRDIRAGIVTHSEPALRKDAGDIPAVQGDPQDRWRPAGSGSADRDSDVCRLETNTERLVEFECSETLPHAPFKETVDAICDDVGAEVDWGRWKIEAPTPSREVLASTPMTPRGRPEVAADRSLETADPP